MMLVADSLECCHRDAVVFTGVSLRVGAGEVLQLQGANGCGKTTLLRVLAGLIPPDRGSVTWQGMPVDTGDSGYHRAMGFLGHRNGIKGELRVAENLAVSRALHGGALPDDVLLAAVGLAGTEHRLAGALSAGQQRRLALACLMLRQTRLWLLDEPLNALDQAGVALVAERIGGHVRAGGAVVVSTHQPLPGGLSTAVLRLDAPCFHPEPLAS